MIGRRNSSAADLYFEFRFRILKIQPIIYLLIGLYLIMPLISPLLRAASRNELRAVLHIWGVTLFCHIRGCLPLSLATRAISATWTYSEKLTFGIYLCHFIFVYISFDLFDIESVNPFLRIIGMTAASFTCAAILTAILRLTPLTRRFIA